MSETMCLSLAPYYRFIRGKYHIRYFKIKRIPHCYIIEHQSLFQQLLLIIIVKDCEEGLWSPRDRGMRNMNLMWFSEIPAFYKEWKPVYYIQIEELL